MATQTRQATGIGTNDTWAASAGTKFSCVDEGVGSANGDTDYITRVDAAGRQAFTFPAFSVAASAVASVVVRASAKVAAGAAGVRLYIRVGGTVYDGANQALTSSYATYTETWATNPATSAAWTAADLCGWGPNPLQEFGVLAQNMAAAEEQRVSAVEIEASYTPAAFQAAWAKNANQVVQC